MKNDNHSDVAGILRQKAEALLKKRSANGGIPFSEVEALKLVHELEVHQIELELQNENLEMIKEETAEQVSKKYAELFDIAPSGYFTITNKGEIIGINLCGSQMLGKDRTLLIGSSFGFFVSEDTKPIFNLFLGKVFNSRTKQSCELTLESGANLPLAVMLNGIVSESGKQCLVTLTDITELKAANNALIESQKLYTDLVSNQTGGIYRILVQKHDDGKSIIESTTVEFVSNRLCEILEIDPLEFSKDGVAAFLGRMNPDDVQWFIESNVIAQQTLEPYIREVRLLIGDRNKWIRLESNPRRLEDGSTRWTGVALDITRYKQGEEALKRSEERQRFILESLPIAVYSSPVNPDFDTMWISGNVKEITGFDKDEYLSENDFWRRRLHPEDKKRVLKSFLNFPTKGELILEYQWMCRDGQYHWFMDRSLLLENESGNEFLGVIVDITDRKKAEEAVRVNEEKYRMLLEFATDAFFQGDENGNLIIVNSVAIELTGFSREELLKMNMKDLFSTETLNEKPLKYAQVKKGEIVKTERELVCKDKKAVIVEMNSRMMPDGTFQSFFRDITDRKTIEAALKRKLSELEIYYDLAITRERKMIALKSEINLLLERLGEKLKY